MGPAVGNGESDRVRGVNLIRIRDGRIVEARGDSDSHNPSTPLTAEGEP